MNKIKPMIYLLILFTLNLSCSQSKTKKNVNQISKSLNAKPVINPLQDTLIFTSGIRQIFQDSKENLWFGSHQEGVCMFDGKSFKYYTVEDGLTDNQVRTIQEDVNGNIWFGTGNGVCSFDGNQIIKQIPQADITAIGSTAFTALPIKNKHLWFNAGMKPGINRFDGQKLSYLPFPVPTIDHSNDPFGFGVTGFSNGNSNYYWISTYSAVFGFDGQSMETIRDASLGLSEWTGTLHVRSILEDSKGKLWIGNNGIGVLLKDGPSIINFSQTQGLIHKNSKLNGAQSPPGTLEHVFVIEEDKKGNIWFGDRDTGLWKYDGKSMTNYIIDNNLQTQMIWDIYEHENGDLFFAMAAGGVYQMIENRFYRVF